MVHGNTIPRLIFGKRPDSGDLIFAALRQPRKTVAFDTALTVLDTSNDEARSRVVPCRVTFRRLTRAQIEAYLEREQPYDCAGSAKAEGLGIALIARIETEDPTSLIGLPLIALTELLAEAGVAILG